MASPLKVLIAGGGISGPSAAYFLSRIPQCDVTVLERDNSLRASGQQIDITGQGLVLLEMMGILKAVRAKRVEEPGMRHLNSQGKTVAFFPVNVSGKGISSTRELEIMRGDLVRILYDLTKDLDGVRYVFGKQIESLSQQADDNSRGAKLDVTLSDGTQETYDIVIGADGVGSPTRKLMLGASHPIPRRDLGMHLAYFTAPCLPTDSTDWTICHMPGGRCMMTRKDDPSNIRVYLATRKRRAEIDAAGTLDEQKAVLAGLFRDAPGAQVQRFLRDLLESPMADDLYVQRMSQVRLPKGQWSRGRVVLTGDAAYCPAAVGSGIGTTSAILGSYVLAGEIARELERAGGSAGSFDLAKAAGEYERIIRPWVEENSNVPTYMGRLFLPETALGVWLIHTIAWLADVLGLDKLMGNSKEEAEPMEKLEYLDYFGLAGRADGHE